MPSQKERMNYVKKEEEMSNKEIKKFQQWLAIRYPYRKDTMTLLSIQEALTLFKEENTKTPL